jgi:hypothetical protein
MENNKKKKRIKNIAIIIWVFMMIPIILFIVYV